VTLALPFPDELIEAIAARVADLVLERVPTPAAEEPWRLLTVDEAAERLGRSTRWVRDHKGEIGWVRLDGRALAFELDDLRAFAREHRIACRPLALDKNTPAPEQLFRGSSACGSEGLKAGAGGGKRQQSTPAPVEE
jgi:hypothetical protein